MVVSPARLTALFGVAGAVLGACQAAAPAPLIDSVSPSSGYTDRPLRLMIHGAGFLPTFDLDPDDHSRRGDVSRFSGRVGSGDVAVSLHDFDWIDVNTLSAWMDPQLPPGTHAVQITDPRGQAAILAPPLGFQALGPDLVPPQLIIESPSSTTPLAPGVSMPIAIFASDTAPGELSVLRWEAWVQGQPFAMKDCVLSPLSGAGRCSADLVVPASFLPGDVVSFTAVAVDKATLPNRAEETLLFPLQPAPTITGVTPARGGTLGGLDVVVEGSGFFPGTRIYLDDMPLLPNGGMRVDNQTVSGRVPPHPAGPVTLVARTPIGDVALPSGFLFAIGPQIDTVIPAMAEPRGGTRVRVTGEGFTPDSHVFFGDSLSTAVGLVDEQRTSDTEIVGMVPAGHGRTTVWVFDPQLGSTRLMDAFEWRAP